MRKPGAQGLSLYSKLGRTQKFGWIPKSKIPEAENGLTKARGQRIIHEEEKIIRGGKDPAMAIGALLRKYLWGYKSAPLV